MGHLVQQNTMIGADSAQGIYEVYKKIKKNHLLNKIFY